MKNLFKKKLSPLLVLLTLSCGSSSAFADASSQYLPLIWQNTVSMLEKINAFPAYIKDLSDMAKSWMKEDDSSAMVNNQSLFMTLGQATPPDIGFTNHLTKTFLTTGNTNAAIPKEANDYSFTTLMGKNAQLQPDQRLGDKNPPNLIQNYIQNASGANLVFQQPLNGSLGGNAEAQKQYKQLYSTVAAIQSYNNYLMNYFTAQLNKDMTMNSLVSQATDQAWLAEIGGQELGKVFREILLYESQSYVLLSRLVQNQERALAAQAMTNTLLIAVSQGAGQMLYQQGVGRS